MSIPAGFNKANPLHWLAYGLGSGFARKAPGTFGTLAALFLYLPMAQLSLLIYCGVVLVAFIAGIWICGRTSAQLGVHDPGGIVWDEFVGLWITLIAVPGGWYGVVSGFVLFRLLDICQPDGHVFECAECTHGLGQNRLPRQSRRFVCAISDWNVPPHATSLVPNRRPALYSFESLLVKANGGLDLGSKRCVAMPKPIGID